MKRMTHACAWLAAGATLLQFGGCVADRLADVFFAVGPLLL
ncbi:MAG: hypothetical protein ACE5E6_05250 [Phycisphaerae bacterium]